MSALETRPVRHLKVDATPPLDTQPMTRLGVWVGERVLYVKRGRSQPELAFITKVGLSTCSLGVIQPQGGYVVPVERALHETDPRRDDKDVGHDGTFSFLPGGIDPPRPTGEEVYTGETFEKYRRRAAEIAGARPPAPAKESLAV